jgi:hypothetical protein
MSPIQMYPDIFVFYIMYICNIICIDKFHIRRVITPMDQMNVK